VTATGRPASTVQATASTGSVWPVSGSPIGPALDAWLAEDDPPVFVGFGSMPILDSAATMDMITTVAARVGVRVLIGAGWSRFGQAPVRPGNRVRVAAGVLNYD
jgi:hypothetical protein